MRKRKKRWKKINGEEKEIRRDVGQRQNKATKQNERVNIGRKFGEKKK